MTIDNFNCLLLKRNWDSAYAGGRIEPRRGVERLNLLPLGVRPAGARRAPQGRGEAQTNNVAGCAPIGRIEPLSGVEWSQLYNVGESDRVAGGRAPIGRKEAQTR